MARATRNCRSGRQQAVTMPAIRRVVRQIVDRFGPRKVVLFGSRAHGNASADSDVDLLVVTRRPMGADGSLRIRRGIEYSFPLDLIVCDQRRLQKRVERGDFLLTSAVQSGKVLYEEPPP